MADAVLCFGNDLHGDDGFGKAVYTALSEHPGITDHLQVHYCGTNSLSLWPQIEDCQKVIIVDACFNPDKQPGELFWSQPACYINQQSNNLHDLGVSELLRHSSILEEGKAAPRFELLLVAVAEINSFCPSLSPEISAQVQPACEAILSEAKLYGEVH